MRESTVSQAKAIRAISISFPLIFLPLIVFVLASQSKQMPERLRKPKGKTLKIDYKLFMNFRRERKRDWSKAKNLSFWYGAFNLTGRAALFSISGMPV